MSAQRRAALAAALLVGLSGCGGSADDEGGSRLTVFAAASLTDVFTELGDRFEQENPGLDVRFTFAGSSALATQIEQGAPADVFAAADEAQMARVVDSGLAADPEPFASNVLEIAVPPGNPARVTGLTDFARDELTLAVCAPEVPCGTAADELFAAANVSARPDTQEEDVRAALTKVQLGEVDAALVYATDVVAAGDSVEGVDVPEADRAVNRYPICLLTDAPDPGPARAFVDLVLSEDGRRALADAGFREP
jgi:molybdate transport system substrate-binding protein